MARGQLAPPVASPSRGSSRVLNPFQSHQTVSPVKHSQGDFALPAPIDLAGVPAPKTPDNAVEATSWRPTLRGLDAVIASALNPIRGLSRRPEPTRRTWRIASPPAPHHARASCPLDRESGKRSCSPRYPHDHFMDTRQGAFVLPLPWNHPIDQPCADWMRAIISKMNHSSS